MRSSSMPLRPMRSMRRQAGLRCRHVVVSFDGTVTEPCAWRVVVDFKDMGMQEVEHMTKLQPKGGICSRSGALPARRSTMPSFRHRRRCRQA